MTMTMIVMETTTAAHRMSKFLSSYMNKVKILGSDSVVQEKGFVLLLREGLAEDVVVQPLVHEDGLGQELVVF